MSEMNRSVVVAFIEAASDEGVTALKRFATEDVRWWAAGLGEFSSEQIIALVQSVAVLLETPMRFIIHDVIAEDDRVAAEVESRATLKNGKVYNNHYHFKFGLRDGRISSVREYHDTRHAHEVLETSMAEAGLSPPA